MFRHRIFNSAIILVGIWVLNFWLVHSGPGDITNLYWGPQTDRESMESLRQQRGLDQPLYQQFKQWTTRFFSGDLGYSWAKHRPVSEILQEAIPATLQLTTLALAANFILGCFFGVLAGIYSDRFLGRFLNFSSLVIYSVPTFWLAMIFILLFSVQLHWLPASQMHSFLAAEAGFWPALGDRIQHLVLPVAVLGLTGAAAISRYVRGSIIEVLQQDYVRLAQAMGLSKRKVYFRHALKNALLPVVTLAGLYLPLLLSGAFVIEVIFAWPGMGRIAYEAIFAKDYPVIFAVNFIAAALVLAGNLLADLLYQFVDPRIRVTSGRPRL